jgi:beta-N-acetylhexosaminidase
MTNKLFTKFLFFILLIFSFSCGDNSKKLQVNNDTTSIKNDTTIKSQVNKKLFTLEDFYKDTSELNKKVEEIFKSLSDTERVGQMVMTSAGELGRGDNIVSGLIKNKKVGGLVILKGSKQSITDLIKKFNKIAENSKSLPLLFSCDGEPSLINKKISGIPEFPKTNSIKKEDLSEKTGADIAKEIKNIGFNWNYAPVCDFDLNKEIIGDRSFGHNETNVTKLATAFIKGTQSNGIIATAKHFPGHGNVQGDTHKKLVWINGEPAELKTFANVIKESGVISIMVGHIAINGGEYDTKEMPSTISKKIITDVLRNKLQFKGIIITDAMNMGGVKDFLKPALSASIAGCDMILMPTDENTFIINVLNRMNIEPDYKVQIYNSIKKIIRLKICSGIIK